MVRFHFFVMENKIYGLLLPIWAIDCKICGQPHIFCMLS